MSPKELGQRLAEISKALGWHVCIVRDEEGVTGVLLGNKEFMETRVGPEDDVWAEKKKEIPQ